jgi:uncharacterized membrane protein
LFFLPLELFEPFSSLTQLLLVLQLYLHVSDCDGGQPWGATLVLFVIGALTLIVLVYWLLQGTRGALQAVLFTAFLLYGTQLAQTLDPGNLESVRVAVFLFGAVAAGVAFLVTRLLSRLIDTTRERRRVQRTRAKVT